MKAILIPIQPFECELIAKGEKRVIVTKRKPTLETPFKGYIYETKDKRYENIGVYWVGGQKFIHYVGKVIGEFVCDKIYEIHTYQESDNTIAVYSNEMCDDGLDLENATCLEEEKIVEYLSNAPKCSGYGWHISDLKIYDKPKDVSEFIVAQHEYIGKRVYHSYGGWKVKRVTNWCYVEEI